MLYFEDVRASKACYDLWTWAPQANSSEYVSINQDTPTTPLGELWLAFPCLNAGYPPNSNNTMANKNGHNLELSIEVNPERVQTKNVQPQR